MECTAVGCERLSIFFKLFPTKRWMVKIHSTVAWSHWLTLWPSILVMCVSRVLLCRYQQHRERTRHRLFSHIIRLRNFRAYHCNISKHERCTGTLTSHCVSFAHCIVPSVDCATFKAKAKAKAKTIIYEIYNIYNPRKCTKATNPRAIQEVSDQSFHCVRTHRYTLIRIHVLWLVIIVRVTSGPFLC